ncbi:MAG: hypothetical protein PHO83_15160 [Geobacteraceae bacterium]|nr:hypothetical protein [Geobacteraceae bacterium]
MSNAKYMVVGIHIQNRVKNAAEVQKILTDFGCSIKTRIGLHEVTDDFCSGSGLILLEMIGPPAKVGELAGLLKKIDGVDVQQMIFEDN